MTKKVVLTEERISHIEEHHTENDVRLVKKYAKKVLKNPKYILEDKNKKRTNTGLVISWIKEKGKIFPLLIIFKMKEKTDPKEYKWRNFRKNEKKLIKYFTKKKINVIIYLRSKSFEVEISSC